MKNKHNTMFETIFSKIFFVVCLICCGLIAYSVIGNEFSWLYVLALVIIFVELLLAGLTHELGHLISARINSFKVVRFSVFGVHYDLLSDKKWKFSIISNEAGQITLIPKCDKDLVHRFKKCIIGGLIGGLLYLLIVIMFAILPIDNVVLKLLGCGVPLALYLFVINAVPFLSSLSDGTLLKDLKQPNNDKTAENYLAIMLALYKGKTYAQIEESKYETYDEKSVFCGGVLLARVRRAIENDDFITAQKLILNTEMKEFCDVEVQLEKYYLSLKMNDTVTAQSLEKDILAYLDSDNSPMSLRILYTRAKALGDDVYASTILKTAERICDNYFIAGEGRFNKKLLN